MSSCTEYKDPSFVGGENDIVLKLGEDSAKFVKTVLLRALYATEVTPRGGQPFDDWSREVEVMATSTISGGQVRASLDCQDLLRDLLGDDLEEAYDWHKDKSRGRVCDKANILRNGPCIELKLDQKNTIVLKWAIYREFFHKSLKPKYSQPFEDYMNEIFFNFQITDYERLDCFRYLSADGAKIMKEIAYPLVKSNFDKYVKNKDYRENKENE